MDYVYSDGIGLRIPSLFMSDNNIGIKFDFKSDKELDYNDKSFDFTYILYNENNEVYYENPGTNKSLVGRFYKENNIKKRIPELIKHSSFYEQGVITKTKNNIVLNCVMTAQDYFPRAKKLYLLVYGIGYYTNENLHYKPYSHSNWKIELDIPERFYNEEIVKYKLKEDTEDVKIERSVISSTSMTMVATIDEINAPIENYQDKLYLTDENNNIYRTISMTYNYNGENINKFSAQFSINKSMLPKRLYLHINRYGKEEKIVELIQE